MLDWILGRGRHTARSARTRRAASDPEDQIEYRLRAYAGTDVGCVRDINEDTAECTVPAEPEALLQYGVLALVADGMGGHACGEVASRIAVDTLRHAYFSMPGPASDALLHAFEAANAAIYTRAKRDAAMRGMGTTAVALALRDGMACYAHVGDSRLYLMRGDGVYRMTEDHTVVMEMVRQGVLTAEQAHLHENRGVLLCALGTRPQVDIAVCAAPFPMRVGDQFLLCSDGLHDLVSDDEMHHTVLTQAPKEAVTSLIALAKTRGGHDNISVIVVRIDPTTPDPTEQDATAEEAQPVNEGDAPPTRKQEVVR